MALCFYRTELNTFTAKASLDWFVIRFGMDQNVHAGVRDTLDRDCIWRRLDSGLRAGNTDKDRNAAGCTKLALFSLFSNKLLRRERFDG